MSEFLLLLAVFVGVWAAFELLGWFDGPSDGDDDDSNFSGAVPV
jgi:hypothetical protein